MEKCTGRNDGNHGDRRMEKRRKKHNWLVNMIRDIAENEEDGGIKFKIVATGGITIKSHLHRSNPTATPGCPAVDCLACAGRRG